MSLVMLLAPSASADTYTDQLVNKFNAQTHVLADPAANPPLQDPDRLNDQILTSRWTWSSTPPIWVAAVARSQTGVTTPDAIHNVILGAQSRIQRDHSGHRRQGAITCAPTTCPRRSRTASIRS